MSNSLLTTPQWLRLLRCPDCSSGMLNMNGDELACKGCDASFPFAAYRPVLLRHDNDLFSIDSYRHAFPSKPGGTKDWAWFVPSPSVNLASERVLKTVRAQLDSNGISKVLVVGGGRQREWLDPLLCAVQTHEVVYSDIDSGADVDLFCDAHDLPFVDGVFDSVITIAVLEHVLYPERVAAEITRVLKTGGLLYSELPFMQQVHEGAYDFTRYTLSGHRRLFNQFAELDAGMVAGPATALVWALENLVLAFVVRPLGRKLAKSAVRLCLGWIKYLDYFLENKPESMDGASCTYFFGAKSNIRVADAELIAAYVGAKAVKHV